MKELCDGTDVRVGTASCWRVEDGTAANGWLYYCEGPADRCDTRGKAYSTANPAFGMGTMASASASGCGFCHGGFIVTTLR